MLYVLNSLHSFLPGFIHECVDRRLVVFSALPYDLDIFSSRASFADPSLHCVVQGAATEASSHNQQVLLFGIKSIEFERLLLHFFRCRYDLFPDRITCHYYPLCREESFHALVCDTNAVCLLSKNLVCQSSKAVLFLDQCRNSEFSCCPKEGSTCISSYSDCNVRLEFADYLLCHSDASDHFERQGEV